MIAAIGRWFCRHLHSDHEWGRAINSQVICLRCLRVHEVKWHQPSLRAKGAM